MKNLNDRYDARPNFRHPAGGFPAGSTADRVRRSIHERYRWFAADGAVRPDLVVVSAPFLHFLAGVVKPQEPVLVRALGPELAIERRDI